MCQLVLPSFAGGILPHRFWSSVELTGNQTASEQYRARIPFWSSVELTGNQTELVIFGLSGLFWSSVELTGNQTSGYLLEYPSPVLEQCRTDW